MQPLLAQLGVLRAQVGALQAQVDAMAELLALDAPAEPAAPPGCTHPETENVGTFGDQELRCVVCKAVLG